MTRKVAAKAPIRDADSHDDEGLNFERIVFFSDALFAIVITLLVLEIKVPEIEALSEEALRTALMALTPKFAAFFVSFALVGGMWVQHHQIFRYIRDYDTGLIWRNLLMLLCVCIIPFPTALISDYYWSQTAFWFYVGSFAAVSLAKIWLWLYVSRHRHLLAPHTTELTIQQILRRSWAVPLGCAVALLLSLVNVSLASFGFLTIPLFARLLNPTPRS